MPHLPSITLIADGGSPTPTIAVRTIGSLQGEPGEELTQEQVTSSNPIVHKSFENFIISINRLKASGGEECNVDGMFTVHGNSKAFNNKTLTAVLVYDAADKLTPFVKVKLLEELEKLRLRIETTAETPSRPTIAKTL